MTRICLLIAALLGILLVWSAGAQQQEGSQGLGRGHQRRRQQRRQRRAPPKEESINEQQQSQAGGAVHKEPVEVLSNFVQDDSLLEELANEQLWRTRAEEMFFPRWINWNHNLDHHEANNRRRSVGTSDHQHEIWDKLAMLMFHDHPLVQQQINGTKTGNRQKQQYFAGYAYSCTILSTPNLSPWYISKDGMAYEYHKPVLQAAYIGYPHSGLITTNDTDTNNGSGGKAFLEILPVDQTGTRGPGRYAQNNPQAVQRVEVGYNRLIRFDTQKWHRFIEDPKGNFKGELFVFFVDLWKFKPQPGPKHRLFHEEDNEGAESVDPFEARVGSRALPWGDEL